jgi:uncharacterized phage-associated protein
MCTARDVASYLVRRGVANDPWTLQKLVYYCQAWSLAWDGERLFPETVEAWRDGPVVSGLPIRCDAELDPGGNPDALPPDKLAIVDAVAATYGLLCSTDLVALSHREPPWREAYEPRENRAITGEAMRRFYSSFGFRRAEFPEHFEHSLALLAVLEPGEEEGLFAEGEEVDGDKLCKWLETGEGHPWGQRPSVA